jgi:hypothetical protein
MPDPDRLPTRRYPSHLFSLSIPLDLVDSGELPADVIKSLTTSLTGIARAVAADAICDTPEIDVQAVPASDASKPTCVVGRTLSQVVAYVRDNVGWDGAHLFSTDRQPYDASVDVQSKDDVLMLEGWSKGPYAREVKDYLAYRLQRHDQRIEAVAGYAEYQHA